MGSVEAQESYDRLVAAWLANGRQLPQIASEPDGPTITVTVRAFLRHGEHVD